MLSRRRRRPTSASRDGATLPRGPASPYLGPVAETLRRFSVKPKGRFNVNDNLFTTYTLAEYLQVSARTVQREVSRGRLTFVMVGGRRRYRREDIEYYLRRQLQRSHFRVIEGGRAHVANLG